jgi:uncharacterized membrane protein YfcA
MRSKTITLPELGLIAGTRAALGAGIGLLLANRLGPEQRRAVGWTLVAVGVLSTFPLAAEVVFRDEEPSAPAGTRPSLREPVLSDR